MAHHHGEEDWIILIDEDDQGVSLQPGTDVGDG